MSKPLVIVESPTKAKTISKILGKNYEVTSSVGHIRDLPKSSKDIPESLKEKVEWNGVIIKDGFKNVQVVPADKLKVVNDLKKKLKKALIRDKKIIKSISYSNKGKIVRGFSYKVKISKKKYMEMVKSKYISVLLGMSHKLISSGLNEIKKKYKKQISFQDKLICLVLNR